MTRTPPPRSPVGFFGESHFVWAPKKPCRAQKSSRDKKPNSVRNLNFSSILTEEDISENKSLGMTRGLRGRVMGKVLTRLPDYESRHDTPNRRVSTSLGAGNSIARRIDFAAITVSQNDSERVSMSPIRVPSSDARRLIAGIEGPLGQNVKRQAVDQLTSIGNAKSAKIVSNGASCSGIKKARLARLLR